MDVRNSYDVDIYSQPSTSTATQQFPVPLEYSASESETYTDMESISEMELLEQNGIETENFSSPIECKEDEFYFDTDHPALKANEDYRKLLYTLITLIDKRAKAVQDLDRLQACRVEALADPLGYMKRLQRGEELGVPQPQNIPEIPFIDWDKYMLTGSQSSVSNQLFTRQLTKAHNFKNETKIFTHTAMTKSSSKAIQPWSGEEQKKLEKLLIKYPPEEIESRRWEKVARELENRTRIQVASRVQKYFVKLKKAGMPIPGRQPNLSCLRKPKRLVIRQQPSTFLVSHTPTVTIDIKEESKDYDYVPVHSDSDEHYNYEEDLSDEDEIAPQLKDSAKYKEIMCIKKILKQKQTSGLDQHVQFKCTRCECEPIVGIRWQCSECSPVGSINFCGDCVHCIHETEIHSASHYLEPIHKAVAFSENDYMHFPGNEFSYLDPNYMPAM